MYPTLFDSFFSPPTIVVVSEERLKAAELKAKEKQLLDLKARIDQLNDYYHNLSAEVAALRPAKAGADLDALDGGAEDA